MRAIAAALILSVIFLVCPSVALGGIVVNGDFEANFAPEYPKSNSVVQAGGPISGWTITEGYSDNLCWGEPCYGLRQSAAQPNIFGTVHGVVAWFGDNGDYIAQQVPTTPGVSYRLSAWLMNLSGGPPNQFEFWWNGMLLDSLADAESFSWQQFAFTVTADSASTEIRLGGANLPGVWALDEVELNGVPEPSGVILCGAGLAGLAGVVFRRRRATISGSSSRARS